MGKKYDEIRAAAEGLIEELEGVEVYASVHEAIQMLQGVLDDHDKQKTPKAAPVLALVPKDPPSQIVTDLTQRINKLRDDQQILTARINEITARAVADIVGRARLENDYADLSNRVQALEDTHKQVHNSAPAESDPYGEKLQPADPSEFATYTGADGAEHAE